MKKSDEIRQIFKTQGTSFAYGSKKVPSKYKGLKYIDVDIGCKVKVLFNFTIHDATLVLIVSARDCYVHLDHEPEMEIELIHINDIVEIVETTVPKPDFNVSFVPRYFGHKYVNCHRSLSVLYVSSITDKYGNVNFWKAFKLVSLYQKRVNYITVAGRIYRVTTPIYTFSGTCDVGIEYKFQSSISLMKNIEMYSEIPHMTLYLHYYLKYINSKNDVPTYKVGYYDNEPSLGYIEDTLYLENGSKIHIKDFDQEKFTIKQAIFTPFLVHKPIKNIYSDFGISKGSGFYTDSQLRSKWTI